MLPSLPFKERFTSSRQLLPGGRINSLSDMLTSASQIVALAGGGQAGAPVINSAYVDLITVATAADSVALPPATGSGLVINITNDGVASANIFPSGTDVINAGGAGAAVALAAGANAEFVSTKAGFWRRYVSS